MRIIYLHQYFNTPSMSGSTRSAEFARRFAAAGHEVHVVTSSRGDRPIAESWVVTEEEGYSVHWSWVPYNNSMSHAQRVWAFAKFAILAGMRAGKLGGDVVFATSTPLTIAIPGAYAAWRRRCPMVLEVRDLWPELPIAIGALRSPASRAAARLLESWAYRRAAHVVALSPGMAEGVISQGVSRDRVSVIPNACDITLFASDASTRASIRGRYEWLAGRPLVLYAGTLGKLNGVGYLARIAHVVRNRAPHVQFAVIGDGAERDKIRSLAADLGVLDNNFHMMPSIGKRDIAGWFASADLVCSLVVDLPQMWMNSANKFFDGIAAGKPVAINYLGWQADMLSSNRAGLILPPAEPEAAGRIIADACSDCAGLAVMGEAARELAIREFDRDKLSRKLLDVLEGVVQS